MQKQVTTDVGGLPYFIIGSSKIFNKSFGLSNPFGPEKIRKGAFRWTLRIADSTVGNYCSFDVCLMETLPLMLILFLFVCNFSSFI